MFAPAATSFLRVPPFPGSRPVVLASHAVGAQAATQAADVLSALRAARVGGSYWAAQPALPATPFVLVRGTAAAVPAEHAALPVVRWVDHPGESDRGGEIVVVGECDPWWLVERAALVVSGDDEDLALVAACSRTPLVRTPDEPATLLDEAAVEAAVHRRVIAGWAYRNPFTGLAEGPLEAIAQAAAWRRLIDRNRSLAGAVGFARWKRSTTEALLWGGDREVRFDPAPADLQPGDRVAAWRSRVVPATARALDARGVVLVEVEDGFIRSAGLGADCVPPLSIVVDPLGPHFDPRGPSELERLLEHEVFADDLLDQAEELRVRIVEAGLGKYDSGHAPLARRADRPHVLVPGQVEDDRAVLSTIGPPLMNLALLERARAAEPDAYLLYKPHPDVEAGHRRGAIPDAQALTLADEVIRDAPMSSVIAISDRLHVNSSLAGFEALMRSKPVTTHGVPFYAGWGLTDDRGPVPARRTARRSLLELIAATLLVYPRYLDPVSGLPCPPDVVVARLTDKGARPAPGALVALRRLQGRVRQKLSFLGGAA